MESDALAASLGTALERAMWKREAANRAQIAFEMDTIVNGVSKVTHLLHSFYISFTSTVISSASFVRPYLGKMIFTLRDLR